MNKIDVENEYLTTLARKMIGNQHVKTLSINTGILKIRTARLMAKAIRRSRITKLILFSFSELRPKGAKVMEILFSEGIKWSSTIRELSLRLCDTGGVDNLIEILPCIRKLSLFSVHIDQIRQLREVLSNADLDEVTIRFRDRGVVDDFRFLKTPSLKTLTLCKATISRGFLNDWPRDSQLETLDLSDCELGAVEILSIMRATVHLRALETLRVQFTATSPHSGFQSIAALLAANTLTIKNLVIVNCATMGQDNERGDVCESFIHALQTNTHLHSLSISCNSLVRGSDREKLEQAIQSCTELNRLRSILASEPCVPSGTWCLVMAFFKRSPTSIFYALQQRPTLVTFNDLHW